MSVDGSQKTSDSLDGKVKWGEFGTEFNIPQEQLKNLSVFLGKCFAFLPAIGTVLKNTTEILGSPIEVVRKKQLFNLAKVASFYEKECLDREILDSNSLPLAFIKKAVEEASLQEDEVLQQSWAALLAHAMDISTQEISSYNVVFLDMLSKFTPKTALILQKLYEEFGYKPKSLHKDYFSVASLSDDLLGSNFLESELLEKYGFERLDIEVSVSLMESLGIVKRSPMFNSRSSFQLSLLGYLFALAIQPNYEN